MKLLSIIPVIATLTLLALTTGCQSVPTAKKGFDFSGYHTFSVLEITATGTYQDPTLVTRLKPPVTETIVESLTAKGFKQVGETEADFQVRVRFSYWEEHGRTEQRRLSLEILDAKTNEVVWSDYRYRLTDTALPAEAVREIIAKMLKPFPPASHRRARCSSRPTT